MASKGFNDKIIRYEKQDNGEYLFSVIDVLDALAHPANARKYWHTIKIRDDERNGQLSSKCRQLKLTSSDGKTYKTDVLNATDILDLISKIKMVERKDFVSFEEWIKAISSGKRNFVLKHKDIAVIEIEININGEISSVGKLFNEKHLPVGTFNGHSLDYNVFREWWKGRAIPSSREGLNDFLESLGLVFPQELLDKSLGLSLSDQYWISPVSDDLKWENVNFFNNGFSEDVGNILLGKKEVTNKKNISLMSPDNTSDGVLKKRWKIINGKRYLIKGGSNSACQEVANEVLASSICKRLNIPFVNYEVIDIDNKKYNLCEDFITGETELVTAWHIKQLIKKDNNTSDYESFITKVESLGIENVRLRIDQMLVLDFIIANIDRHYNNFGLIRNANTLEWLSVAPIYDSGTSMWCREMTEAISTHNDKLESKPFRNKHVKQIELVKDFSWLNLSTLEGIDKEYASILSEIMSGTEYELRNIKLCNALITRIKLLKDIVSHNNT
ncbi:MAG: HipA domain-containing protein [Bacillales bacterium]|nr:HipA domain-containing protein [Bacillales bacterium]